MILRIDHVSLCVEDIEQAKSFFQNVFGAVQGAQGHEETGDFEWQIHRMGDLSRLELISPTHEQSFLTRFLANKKGQIHHITLQADDMDHVKTVLRKHNIPYFGYRKKTDENWEELFIHPKDAFGVLIQIAVFCPNDYLPRDHVLPADRPYSVTTQADGIALTVSHPGGGTASVELDRQQAKDLARRILKAVERPLES